MRKSFYQSRKFKYGSVATAFTIAFVAIVVIFNIIFSALASKYMWYIDMTTDKVFTLSEEAKDIMSDIKNEVNIYFASEPDVLMTTGSTASFTRYIYNTACQLEDEFENVNVECVNIFKHPSFFRDFYTTAATDIDSDSVVIESNGEVRVMTAEAFFYFNDTSDLSSVWAYNGEKKMISGIMQVTQADSPKVVFTTEHGEDLASATALASLFDENGFEVETVNLTKDELDDDSRILVIFNPIYDFVGIEAEDASKDEIAKIDKFLDGYGTLLVFCNPEYVGNLTNLNEFLEEWGIAYTADTTVRDADHSMSVDNYSIVAAYQAGTLGASLYDRDLNSLSTPPKAIISKASPINILWEQGGGLSGSRMVSPVLTSYDTAELVVNGQAEEKGAFNLVTISRETVIEQNEYYYSYVFAFGSSTFGHNNYINSNAYANEDILCSAMLAAGRERVLAELTLKPFDNDEITVTTKEANDLTLALTLVLPLILTGCGLVVITRRKHS